MCLEQNKLCLVTSSPDGTLGVIAVILHYCNILDKAQWFILSPRCFRRLCFSPDGSTADPAAQDPWEPCRLPLGACRSLSRTVRKASWITAPNITERHGLHSSLRPEKHMLKWLHFLISQLICNLIFFNPDCLLPPSVLLPDLFCLRIGPSSASQLDPCDPLSWEMTLLNHLFAKWTEVQSLHYTFRAQELSKYHREALFFSTSATL